MKHRTSKITCGNIAPKKALKNKNGIMIKKEIIEAYALFIGPLKKSLNADLILSNLLL